MTSMPSKRSGAMPRPKASKIAELDRWAKDGLAQMNRAAARAVRDHAKAGRDTYVMRGGRIQTLRAPVRTGAKTR